MTIQFCIQDHIGLVEELSEPKRNHLADLVEHLVASSSLSLTVFKVLHSYLSTVYYFFNTQWPDFRKIIR